MKKAEGEPSAFHFASMNLKNYSKEIPNFSATSSADIPSDIKTTSVMPHIGDGLRLWVIGLSL